MYKGIVLDKMQRNASLAMAANENLICEKGMTDGVFKMVTCRMPSYWAAEMILEQFTVAGAVYVDPFTYRCLDGKLIENGIIMPYKKIESNLTDFLTFDVDIVQWMMAEKGLDVNYFTTDKIKEIFDKWKEMAREFFELKEKYKLDYQVVKIQQTLKLMPDYGDIDIDHFLELGDRVCHNPVIDVLKEYQELFSIAYYNDLLSPVINAAIPDGVDFSVYKAIFPVMETAKAVKILKYTSERLNRVYIAASLRDNIKLLQTSEAEAYRSKVNEWLGAFSQQDYDNMQIIENDIVKAQNAMKFKNLVEVTGRVLATIGVVATASNHFPLTGPTAVANGRVSEFATYWVAPTAFANLPKKHLWASFGLYSR